MHVRDSLVAVRLGVEEDGGCAGASKSQGCS